MPRKKGRGLSLVRTSGGLEIGERLGLCICAHTRVFMRGGRGGGCGARDARIKKRLVEIKALLQSLPAGLWLTRMTNPSFITLR